MLRGTLRRSFREGSTVSVLGTHALTIDELGLAAKSSHGEGRISWAAVSRVEDTAHYVYIHTFPGSGVVVPKRAFGNDAEASAFLANVLALKKGGV